MDAQEIWSGIRAVMIGDATLTALLASSTAVYKSAQSIPWADGVITIAVITDNPQTEFSQVGVWRPALQINCYHSVSSTAWDMVARLDTLLDIPRKRASVIQTTRYNVRLLQRTNCADLGPVIKLPDNKWLNHLACDWKATVVSRND